ncbi:hypothetical protein HDF16_004244 [Granulicella aggregans]|uniref:Uncharacterized protein n=1 Tax=Granulicella aggregans TaxID=474949 RepID=A0A7W7ZGX0_9BACT|nr:hypothetical protein [Granulicella aggregans]
MRRWATRVDMLSTAGSAAGRATLPALEKRWVAV